jgi:hypothetical protein
MLRQSDSLLLCFEFLKLVQISNGHFIRRSARPPSLLSAATGEM